MRFYDTLLFDYIAGFKFVEGTVIYFVDKDTNKIQSYYKVLRRDDVVRIDSSMYDIYISTPCGRYSLIKKMLVSNIFKHKEYLSKETYLKRPNGFIEKCLRDKKVELNSDNFVMCEVLGYPIRKEDALLIEGLYYYRHLIPKPIMVNYMVTSLNEEDTWNTIFKIERQQDEIYVSEEDILPEQEDVEDYGHKKRRYDDDDEDDDDDDEDDEDDEDYDEDELERRDRMQDGQYYMYSYDYVPKPFIFHNLYEDDKKDLISLGLELEVECKPNTRYEVSRCFVSHSNNEKKFYLMHDGSLRNGIEVVTHPMIVEQNNRGLEQMEKHLETILSMIEKYTTVSSRCGFHIHVGRKYLKEESVCKLEYLFELFEDELSYLSRRLTFEFTTIPNTFICNENKRDKKNCIIPKLYGEDANSNKYVAVNTQHDSTVEIRLWTGVNKMDDMLDFVALTIALVRVVNKKTFLEISHMDFQDVLDIAGRKRLKELYRKYLKEKKDGGR